MTTSEHATHRFAPEASSPGAARRFVRQTLTDWGAQSLIDDAVLLTNELVTNAVVHAGTALNVSCALGPDYVQIGVTDSHASRSLPPAVANPSAEKTSGRGLYLLSQIAQAWGVEYEQATKRVWFRLPLATSPEEPGIARQPTHFIDLGPATAPVRVAVVETDLAGRIRHWSGEAEQLLGWPADKALGRPLADLVVALPDAEVATFAELLTLPRWYGEYVMRTALGDERAVFASHVHVAAGEEPRVVALVVPADHRAVLMPATTAADAAGEASADPEPAGPVPSRPGLLPLDSLLELAVGHSRDLLDGDAAYALLVTDDDLDVELRATTGLARFPTSRTRWRKPADLAGDSGTVRAEVYDDLNGHSIPERFLGEAGMHGLVTAPLRVGDRVVGRVGVASRRPAAFAGDEAARLQRSVDRFSLAVESARLNEVERARRGRLSFLAEASDLLAGMLDPDMAAALAAQLVVPRLADWCAVYLVDQRRRGRLSCVWHAHEERIDPLRRLLLQVPPPVMEGSGRPQQWPALREALADGGAGPDDVAVAGGPTVTVTLLARGRAIGTLIAGLGAGQEFRTGSLDTLDDLGRRAAWALDNARLYRERTAISKALQRSLLPAALPAVPGLDIGIAYEAAGEGIDVGGDFYDVFAVGPGHWGFVIGDVCGKGAEAAAVAGLARHSLRVLAREHRDVPGVLQRLNATILAEGEATRFVTLIYGEVAPEPGGMTVTFAAAGHPLPTLVGIDGTVEVVGTPQPLLGVFPEPAFRSDTLRIAHGQYLVCTTDGVTDRRVGGRTLGERGLRNLLRQTASLPAAAVATRIHSTVLEFGPEPLQDDFAVLVLQPDGSGEPGGSAQG
jgi:PAS domain S-box-containing protein